MRFRKSFFHSVAGPGLLGILQSYVKMFCSLHPKRCTQLQAASADLRSQRGLQPCRCRLSSSPDPRASLPFLWGSILQGELVS